MLATWLHCTVLLYTYHSTKHFLVKDSFAFLIYSLYFVIFFTCLTTLTALLLCIGQRLMWSYLWFYVILFQLVWTLTENITDPTVSLVHCTTNTTIGYFTVIFLDKPNCIFGASEAICVCVCVSSRRWVLTTSAVVVGVRLRRLLCNTVNVEAFRCFDSSTAQLVAETVAVDLGARKLFTMFSFVALTTSSSASASCRFVAASAEQQPTARTRCSMTTMLTTLLKMTLVCYDDLLFASH